MTKPTRARRVTGAPAAGQIPPARRDDRATAFDQPAAARLAHAVRNDAATIALVVSSLKIVGAPGTERQVSLLDRAVKSLTSSARALDALLAEAAPRGTRPAGRRP